MSDHDWRTCEEDDCSECQELVDQGIIMACDECDMPGHKSCDTWTLMDDGRTLCPECHEHEREPLLTKEKVAEYVKKNPGIDALDVACHFDMSLPKAVTIIKELMDEGTLVPADKPKTYEEGDKKWNP